MVLRKIIEINESKCNGCGNCVPNCYEGALQIIDGKARLISDLFCDGLGACIGHCPQNAIKIIEKSLKHTKEKKEKERLEKLEKVAKLRVSYCSARISLEEARVLGKQGKHLEAAEKFSSAATQFRDS